MMSWAPEGTVRSWATLDDAIAGAAELTSPSDVPMLAITLAADGRYAAHNVSVNMARPGGGGQRWAPWYLENIVKAAGPAVVDWSTAPANVLALVDGPAVLRRRF
jgi:hypothetical protein